MNFILASIIFNLNELNYENIIFSFGKFYKCENTLLLLNFKIFIYIMEILNWKFIFDKNFSKTKLLENALVRILENDFQLITIF